MACAVGLHFQLRRPAALTAEGLLEEKMTKRKRKRRGRTRRTLIALLVVVLAVAVGVIVWKTREYAAGAAFYDSLRGGR